MENDFPSPAPHTRPPLLLPFPLLSPASIRPPPAAAAVLQAHALFSCLLPEKIKAPTPFLSSIDQSSPVSPFSPARPPRRPVTLPAFPRLTEPAGSGDDGGVAEDACSCLNLCRSPGGGWRGIHPTHLLLLFIICSSPFFCSCRAMGRGRCQYSSRQSPLAQSDFLFLSRNAENISPFFYFSYLHSPGTYFCE